MPILQREPDLHPVEMFDRPEGLGPWWVAHVRSRQEKRLARCLRDRGVAYYLPQREHARRVSGRQIVSYLPLFPGYVFFRGASEARLAALTSQVVVRALPVDDQVELERELAQLWSAQLAGARLVPHAYLAPGDAIEIAEGPFRGFRGAIVRAHGDAEVVVSVTLLRRSVAIRLEREAIVPAFRSSAPPAEAKSRRWA